MKASRQRIAKVIADNTLRDGNNKRLASQIAAYLLSEGRTEDLSSIVRDVQDNWAKSGYVEVNAISAFPLDNTVRSEIKNEVKNVYKDAREVIITETIEPEVVGGVRLELPNYQLDLSIRSELNKFKQLAAAGKD
jgi:F0F1-type ATP synthase delta subunit